MTLPPDARNAATELEQRQHGQLADRRPLTWDANGNLTTKGDLAYRYDYRNRLVDVRDVASGETLATFTYDAFNRRITKQTLFAQHETVWAGWRALEEHREGVLRWRKVYGGGLD